ncbi:HIT family protein [Candidatus Kuenenbacteria bacterium]|nr:HIT family protein [Candidatus Kuenenbacteria bacterium]
MPECIFCKIIKGEIPSDKIYEDDLVLVFLDISPINKGHALAVPKEHYENLLETPEELAGKMMAVVKKVAKAIKIITNAEGINIGINNGLAAGQSVFHAHIHVIPRYLNDGYKLWGSDKIYGPGESQILAEKIKSEIN